MVLSNSLTFEPVSRDRLFFDQYEYSMRFQFFESGRMRSLTHEAIARACAFSRGLTMFGGYRKAVSPETEQQLMALCDTINAIDQPFKRIVYTDWQYFYTNHAEIFETLAQFPNVNNVSYQQAKIDRPRDVIVRKHSQYQWRSYFREAWYTGDQIATLGKFLLSRPDQFAMTPYWQKRWTASKYMYVTRSNFVDHRDQNDVLLLQIALPGCVRKTLPIVQSQ